MRFSNAHQIANNTCRNGVSSARAWSTAKPWGELRRDARDGHDEGPVEQQFERSGGAVWFVGRPLPHPDAHSPA
jgi:hypothetical protein